MELRNVLIELGLTNKESDIYLALLEIGRSSVLDLSKKSAIKRPTVYTVLISLADKGLVLSIPKGKTTVYQAVEPDSFLRKFEKKVEIFKQVLPELKTISNTSPTKPKVRFYEGKKNILDLYENEIFEGNEIYGITSITSLSTLFSHKELFSLLQKLKSRGGIINDLLEKSEKSREYSEKKDSLNIGKTMFLPKDFKIEVDLLIYKNSVALVSPRNLMVVVITDSAINKLQKMFFDTLWEISPKENF